MLRKKHIIILTVFFVIKILLTSSYTCYSQTRSLNVDSLEAVFLKNKGNTSKSEECLKIADQLYTYHKISDPQKSIYFAEAGVEIALNINDSLILADFYKKIGKVYFNQKVYYQAMDAFFKALSIFELKNMKTEYANSLTDIADTYLQEGINNSFALNYYNEAIEIFKEFNDEYGLSYCYDKVAIIYSKTRNYEEALNYANKSLTIRQTLNDDYLIAVSFFDLAKIYKKQKLYFEAKTYFLKSLSQFGEHSGIKSQNYYELADIFLQENDFEQAEIYINLALNIHIKNYDNINLANSYSFLSKVYFTKKEYDEAITFAQKALSIAQEHGFLEQKEKAYLILSNIYADIDEIDLALRSYHKYSKIKDSLFVLKNQDKYTELQVAIETLTKEKENEFLRKEKEINEVKNRQHKQILYLTIGGLVLLSVIIVILSRLFALKKTNEKRLLESEKRFRQFAEATQEGIAIHDGKKILEVNDRFCKITGYNRHELLGENYLKLIAKENIELVKRKISNEGEEFYESIYLKKDGTAFYADVVSKPFMFRNVKAKVVSVRDLTEFRQTEKKLKETEIRYKALIDTSPDGVMILDMDGKISYVSDAFIAIFEAKDENDFLHKNFCNFLEKEYCQKLMMDIKNILSGKYSGVSEILAVKLTGQQFYIEINGEAVKSETGKILGVFIIVRDISERKLTENALIESETRFRGLFDNAKDAIIIQTLDNMIVDVNPYTSILFGYTYEELLDTYMEKLIVRKEKIKINFEKYANSIETLELEALKKNKDKINIQVSVSRVYFSNMDYLMLIVRDITEQKNNENNIRLSSEKLKISNATKDKMFSIIAHDLRGPIGNLKAMMEVILETPESFEEEEFKEIIKLLKDSSVSTYELLENLLSWAKSQQNLIEYNPKTHNINKIINSTVKLFKNWTDRKNIKIHTDLSQNIKVIADENMVRTVLRNLINNAIKFSNENCWIKIACKTKDDKIIVSVQDNGVGISEENINKLFDNNQFYSTYGTNQEKGSGLGLPLCKEFVEKNNGTIWVESQKNKGTTFYFTLRRH